MKRKRGRPRLYLAASGVEDMPVANTEERLLALLATLEESSVKKPIAAVNGR
ncbi:hypothetical protein AB7M43_005172 [Bradyrhizobium elkanii]